MYLYHYSEAMLTWNNFGKNLMSVNCRYTSDDRNG